MNTQFKVVITKKNNQRIHQCCICIYFAKELVKLKKKGKKERKSNQKILPANPRCTLNLILVSFGFLSNDSKNSIIFFLLF